MNNCEHRYNCEHRWQTIKFIEEDNGWTHNMKCIKCGARRTVIHQYKNKTE